MISGIVLAAGAAKRMGQQKLLLDFQGKPVLSRVLEAVLASQLYEVICVVRELKQIRHLGVPPRCRKIALINQADTPEEVKQASHLGHEMIRCGIERAVITSYLEGDPVKEVITK